jgi:phage terminase small subunit
MPSLKNAKHELFAQALFKGETTDQAYQLAGFKANRGNATRLKANESIVARLDELQGRAESKAVVDRAWVLKHLRTNAETCMTMDFVRGPDGQPTTAVTHNPAAANKALELLGKEMGMFKDQHEISGPDGGAIQTEDKTWRQALRSEKG